MASQQRAAVNRFADYTSSHGIADVKRSRGSSCMYMWMVACTGAWILCIYQVWVSLIATNNENDPFVMQAVANDYFRWETRTTVQLTSRSDINFPAVTLCNVNPLKFVLFAIVQH